MQSHTLQNPNPQGFNNWVSVDLGEIPLYHQLGRVKKTEYGLSAAPSTTAAYQEVSLEVGYWLSADELNGWEIDDIIVDGCELVKSNPFYAYMAAEIMRRQDLVILIDEAVADGASGGDE